jgi:diguanylate cyclase (GGDEF)-like protein/PAS domain S-box-containing protein
VLFEYIRDAVLLVEEGGTVLDCNPAALRMYGRSREEFIGASMADIRDIGALSLPQALATSAQADEVLFETRQRRPDGTSFSAEVSARVIRLGDGTSVHLAVVRDLSDRERTEAAVVAAQAELEQIFETAANGMRVIDLEYTVVRVNTAFTEMVGLPAEQCLGRKCFDVYPGERCATQGCPVLRVISGAPEVRDEALKYGSDGTTRTCVVTAKPLIHEGALAGVIEDFSDVTELRRQSAALERAHDSYLQILADFPMLVWRSDPAGRRDYLNAAMLEFTGRQMGDLLGDGWMRFVHPEDLDELGVVLRDAHAAHIGYQAEYRMLRRDGEWRWIEETANPYLDLDGKHAGYVGSGQDISERRMARETIEHMAYHDALTGLPNRALVIDRLAMSLASAERDGAEVGVLYCDIDNFKSVNDAYGHAAGDRLLKAVTERAKPVIRKGDTLGRFGGDEFVVLLPRISGLNDAEAVAAKLLAAVTGDLDIAGYSVPISLSIGVAVAASGVSADALLGAADRAMYAAKARGGAGIARSDEGE